uniref:HNH nuclease domain-containing protein n=1 Tax=Mycena chlorophos TaxID=658473 RepID=A0ABQ0LYF2_MYCCL|nr:predicted protein [Mycena chlorophos]
MTNSAPLSSNGTKGTVYYFRVPRGQFRLAHAVDLGLVHKDSSTSTDASCEDELRSALEQRDKFCIFTGRAARRSVTAYIIPSAKAHWLPHIIATRLHANEDMSTLVSIDDVRNALLVERNTHAALGTSELAVLCTPNPILATTNVPPAAPRTLLDGTSYPPDGARYTAQWLEPPSFGDLAQNTDAAFATEASFETMPSQLLLTYRYGVAAVVTWAIGDAESLLATPSCEERARLGLPPRPSTETLSARGPKRKRKRDERREEAHDLVLALWLGRSDAQRQIIQQRKEFSDRVQEWREQVPPGGT